MPIAVMLSFSYFAIIVVSAIAVAVLAVYLVADLFRTPPGGGPRR